MQNGSKKNGIEFYQCARRLNINSICVYLGSNEGDDPSFGVAVDEFGAILATNQIRLVCGGGGRGLMRRLVRSVIEHGGQVLAITPQFLVESEGRDTYVQEQIITEGMHERKRIMFESSDAFVALPGGVGTLEELVEQLTWAQLGRHSKPIGIYNHHGFWDPLLELFAQMRERMLITAKEPIRYGVAHEVAQIIPVMCGEMESLGRVHKIDRQAIQLFTRSNHQSTS